MLAACDPTFGKMLLQRGHRPFRGVLAAAGLDGGGGGAVGVAGEHVGAVVGHGGDCGGAGGEAAVADGGGRALGEPGQVSKSGNAGKADPV